MTILLLISFIAIVSVIGSASIGATINDLRATRRRIYRSVASASQADEPIVTIFVKAADDAIAVQNTLENILESSYRSIEIILIGEKRQRSKLKKITHQFAGSKCSIILFTGSGSLRAAYRRYGHGEIILTLRTNERLDRHAIEHAVRHFSTLAGLARVQAYTAPSLHYSSIGLLQTHAGALVLPWRKLMNLIISVRPVRESGMSFYRVGAFLKESQGLTPKTFFADDVVIHMPAVTLNYTLLKKALANLDHTYRDLWRTQPSHPLAKAYRRLLACCLAGMLLTLPFTFTYAAILAISALQPMLLFIITAVASACILTGVWSHPIMMSMQKFSVSYLLPACFIPLYLATFVYAIMTIAILLHTIANVAARALRLSRKLQPD